MHIPDGFIDAKTTVVTAGLAATAAGMALRQVRSELAPKRVPLLGLAAAFLFAAQMVNFPVIGGTSGHLIGGALIAALLGPGAAIVVLTAVLIVQCFLFADGGLLALGTNVFNMGVVATMGGSAAFRLLRSVLPGLRGQVAAVAFAGWFSIVAAAVSCAGQLAWSGTVAWSVAFPTMAGVHMLIGLGEGLISALVFLAIARTRPDLIGPPEPALNREQRPANGLVVVGVLAAFGLALFVAPFACPWPDGLESVAVRLGFEVRATEPVVAAPAADYLMPGFSSPVVATAVAGAAGTLGALGLALLLGWLLVRKRDASPASPRPA